MNSIRYHSCLQSVVFVMRNRDFMCDLQCWIYLPLVIWRILKKKKLHTHYYQMSIQNINLTMHHCLFNFTSDTLHHEKSVQIPLSNFTYFLTEAEILFNSVFWRDCRKSRISLIKKWTNLLLISFIVNRKLKFIHFLMCLLNIKGKYTLPNKVIVRKHHQENL